MLNFTGTPFTIHPSNISQVINFSRMILLNGSIGSVFWNVLWNRESRISELLSIKDRRLLRKLVHFIRAGDPVETNCLFWTSEMFVCRTESASWTSEADSCCGLKTFWCSSIQMEGGNLNRDRLWGHLEIAFASVPRKISSTGTTPAYLAELRAPRTRRMIRLHVGYRTKDEIFRK